MNRYKNLPESVRVSIARVATPRNMHSLAQASRVARESA